MNQPTLNIDVEKEKIKSEASIFWELFAENLPKSLERSALGDKKIYDAFFPAYMSFRKHLLSQQRKEIVEWSKQLIGKHNARILNEFQKQGTTEMPFIAYDERVCLIPAITIAMEETDDDIITKLSEEK